jgi:hypothetical protein
VHTSLVAENRDAQQIDQQIHWLPFFLSATGYLVIHSRAPTASNEIFVKHLETQDPNRKMIVLGRHSEHREHGHSAVVPLGTRNRDALGSISKFIGCHFFCPTLGYLVIHSRPHCIKCEISGSEAPGNSGSNRDDCTKAIPSTAHGHSYGAHFLGVREQRCTRIITESKSLPFFLSDTRLPVGYIAGPYCIKCEIFWGEVTWKLRIQQDDDSC